MVKVSIPSLSSFSFNSDVNDMSATQKNINISDNKFDSSFDAQNNSFSGVSNGEIETMDLSLSEETESQYNNEEETAPVETFAGIPLDAIIEVTKINENGQRVKVKITFEEFIQMYRDVGLMDNDIVRIINQKTDLASLFQEILSDSDNSERKQYLMSKFKELCYDSSGNIRLVYSNSEEDQIALLLANLIFLDEIEKSNKTHYNTKLYEEFVRAAINASKKNYLQPADFAYIILRNSVIHEAFTADGEWKLSPYSKEYYFSTPPTATDYGARQMAINGNTIQRFRTPLGDEVVEAFYNLVSFYNTKDRLNRSLEYGMNFEEAFYLSYCYYEKINPEFEAAYNDLLEFGKGGKLLTNLNGVSSEVISYMKNNELYSHLFDSSGKLSQEYNINSIEYEAEKIIRQQELTEAVLLCTLIVASEKRTNAINQLVMFNTFISPSYASTSTNNGIVYKRNGTDQKGLEIYLSFATNTVGNKAKTNIGEYLKNEILTPQEFYADSKLTEKYKDYKAYCMNSTANSGDWYKNVEEFFKGKGKTTEEIEKLYNSFNDNIIDVASMDASVYLGTLQMHENVLVELESESSENKIISFLKALLNQSEADQYYQDSAMFSLVGDEENAQKMYQTALDYTRSAVEHFNMVFVFSDMKHMYSDLQIETKNRINDMKFQTVNFTSKYSYFYDYIDEFKKRFASYELKYDIVYYGENSYKITYRWENNIGERLQLSNEEMALSLLFAEKNLSKEIDWDHLDGDIGKITENIKYLEIDADTNYDLVLNYLMFSSIKNPDGINQQINNFSDLGFDTEARRRANEYTKSYTAEVVSKLFGAEIEEGSIIETLLELGSGELLLEKIIVPSLHGVDGYIKSVGYAITDTLASIFGYADKLDYSVSMDDQMWSYIIQNYKGSSGFKYANYYFSQALICLGNQVIPIALSIITENPYIGMAALGISAYGHTLHSSLAEFVQYIDPKTGEWADGHTPFNAILYATLDAACEMFLERFVGGMPGLSSGISIGLKGLLKSILSEMIEESLQEIIGPFLKDVATGDLIKTIGDNGFGYYLIDYVSNKVSWESVKDAAIIAAISAGIMNGAQNGKAIIQSLELTNGKNSSIIQLLNNNKTAMKIMGFSDEQIQLQYDLDLQAAVNNASNLKQLTQELLSDPSFNNEYNNWLDGLNKKDIRTEYSIEDYAQMKVIQNLSFNTTELTMQLMNNTNTINQLLETLTDGKETHFIGGKFQDSNSIINTINLLNEANENIEQQLNDFKVESKKLFDNNNQTIIELKNELKGLETQIKTCSIDEKANIQTKINETTSKIVALTYENSNISLSINDNISDLETKIELNEKTISSLKELTNNNSLKTEIIDALNNQISIIEKQQGLLNEKLTQARNVLAASLVSDETELIRELVGLERINKTDITKLKPNEIEYYKTIDSMIEDVKQKLEIVDKEIMSLEEKGVEIKERATIDSIKESNQQMEMEINELFEGKIKQLELEFPEVLQAPKVETKLTVESIKDVNIDINELGINIDNINTLLDSMSLTEQMELFDSIYTRLSMGQLINNDVYKSIFTSKLFSADNAFAENYLHHFLENLTPGDSRLADTVSNIYNQARKSTKELNLDGLYSYCDHTQAHTVQVAFLTLKALNAISEEVKFTQNPKYLQMIKQDYKEMFVAGLLHDLGMSAGSIIDGVELLQGVNGFLKIVDGKVVIEAEDLDFNSSKLANIIRENHSLNSAIAILGLREELSLAGLDADELAMICYSHSKSNSGVGNLIALSDWSLCVDKIQNAVSKHNSHLNATQVVFDLSKIGKYDGNDIITESKQKVKNDSSKHYVQVQNINYDEKIIESLSTKAYALRIGDAYVTKAKIKLDTPISWKYNDETYVATEAVLTQTGFYMLYDKSKKVLFERINNSAASETANAAAFAYFALDENGNFVPCMFEISEDGDKIIKSLKINEQFTKENGVFIFNEDNKPFMDTMGKLKESILINGIAEKCILTDKNYYILEDNNNSNYYQKTEDGNVVLKYTKKTTDDIITCFDVENNTEITVEVLDEITGNTIKISTGQFLAGESNVEYQFYKGEVYNNTTSQTLKGLISDMIIDDADSFVYNTLDKGIKERLGESDGAKNLERIINIKFADQQSFAEMFEIVLKDNMEYLIAKSEIGKIYIDELFKYSQNYNELKILVEGYEIIKDFDISNIVKIDNKPSQPFGITRITKTQTNTTSADNIMDTINKERSTMTIETRIGLRKQAFINANSYNIDEMFKLRVLTDLDIIRNGIKTELAFADLKEVFGNHNNLRLVENACNIEYAMLDELRHNTTMFKNVTINTYGTGPAMLITRNKVQSYLSMLPNEMRAQLREVNIYNLRNPHDIYWKIKRNWQGDFVSAATGGNGSIDIWNGRIDGIDIIVHETGHTIDTLLGNGNHWTTLDGSWVDAMLKDKPILQSSYISEYARLSQDIHEDFADSFVEYLKDPIKFAKLTPYRAQIISSILNYLKNNSP